MEMNYCRVRITAASTTPSFHRRRNHPLSSSTVYLSFTVYSCFIAATRVTFRFPTLLARFFLFSPRSFQFLPGRSEGLRGFLDTFASHAVIWRASETAWRRGEEDRISLLGISRSCSLEASNNRTTEVRVPLPYLPSHPPPILYVRLKFAR